MKLPAAKRAFSFPIVLLIGLFLELNTASNYQRFSVIKVLTYPPPDHLPGHFCELCRRRMISMVFPLTRKTAMNDVFEITSSRVPSLRPGRPEIGGVPANASTCRSICSSWLIAANGFCCAMKSSCWNRLALAFGSHLIVFKQPPVLA